jgi:tetratricopeptide (TPR) repeat protein
MLALALAGAQVATQPGSATQTTVVQEPAVDPRDDPETKTIDEATQLMRDGKQAAAMALADQVIAANESRHRNDQDMVFSARSMTEALLYTTLAATQKKSAVVLNGNWASAEFLKAYALVDLSRGDEAKPFLDKAIALSPMNAQFLAERGEWYKSRKDWPHAYADFEAAATDADFSPDEVKSFEKRRGWRGMAFVRTEQGQLDEAEKLYKQCLKMDPSDENAQHELEYIKSLRQHPQG